MLPPDAVGYFNTLKAGKFLATQSKDGKVNVVFIATMKAYDDRTLVFGNMMLRKSHGNLEDDDKVSACVVTENLKSYEVKGKFKGFERSGKYFDEISNIPVIRYIAYGALRSVGIIEVEDISIPLKRPILGLVSGIATTRLLSKKSLPAGKMPPNVMEKFERLQAIKVIAAREDGYPRINSRALYEGGGPKYAHLQLCEFTKFTLSQRWTIRDIFCSYNGRNILSSKGDI